MMSRGYAVVLAATVVLMQAGGVSAAVPPTAGPGQVTLFYDNFASGFSTSGTSAKWFEPRTDAVVSAVPGDLTVAANGVNPETGEPAFTYTVPQDDTQDGIADHGKWVALAIPPGSVGGTGLPAFAVQPGTETTCRTSVAVQTFGTEEQPFGSAVPRPQADPRLADIALTVNDVPDGVLFDFMITNDEIWARYESVQLPSGGTNPASFAYTVPVASRTPGTADVLAISYDSSANDVVYSVNGRDVLTVIKPGTYSLPRGFLAVDHGGVPRVVSPAELACGVGMFTLLDDRLPGDTDVGLVRLAGAPDFYFDPLLGPPAPERFIDNQSLPQDRLWGQGAKFEMHFFAVTSAPARLP